MKISPEILNMVPYKPGKPISETQREYGVSQVFKLASNENPMGPSPLAMKAVTEALKQQHRYPDPTCYELIQTVSRIWGFSPNMISAGNGSDEILDILIRIYCEPRESILTCQAAFAAYEVSAQAARVKTLKVPLKENFKYDLLATSQYFLDHPEEKIRLIFIPNPNNPTGTYVSQMEVEEFLDILGNRQDVLLVFDEAYNEFVRAVDYRPADEYVKKYNNVVVLRTFSKAYGLAGLRVGILLAPPDVIEVYNRVRKPFNVNDLAQVAAIAALQDRDFIEASRQLTWKGLDYFYNKLEKLGLPFIPSQGNFVLFDTLRDARLVNEALLKKGVILRPVLNYGLPTHLRMSVGTVQENEAAVKALEEILPAISKIKEC